jgi:hypothetical protein
MARPELLLEQVIERERAAQLIAVRERLERNVAMAAQPTVTAASSEKSTTVGIEANSTKRSRSQTTMV